MDAIEERVETLETSLQRFVVTTNAAILRLDQTCERLDRTCERLDRNVIEIRMEVEQMREEGRRHTVEMAQIANRIGRFAEDFVNPNIPRVAREVFGLAQFEFEGQRVKRWHVTDPGRSREFDCVIAGSKHLLISEAKLTARAKDLDDFAESLKDIFDYFTEYRGYTLAPIFASLALSPDLVRRLTRHKIYALALGERTMELLNVEAVRARRTRDK